MRDLLFRILGPLEVAGDGVELKLGGGRQRALLALLLLRRNEVVSTDRIVDALWGEGAPATATKVIQGYVSLLRKALGEGVLVTRPPGYVLEVARGEVDVDRFEQLVERARREEPRDAARTLSEALALWRGPALADMAYESFAQTEISRLEELRLAALEDEINAELALGRASEAVPELEALVREHPLRERLRAQLMLALYRSGRQADALKTYVEARRLLVDELGIEPGPELRALQRRILAQDPELGGIARPTALALAARQRWKLVVAGAILLVAAATAAAIALTRGGSSARVLAAPPQSLIGLDPATGRARVVARLATDPVALAEGRGALWVASGDTRTLIRVDGTTGNARRIPLTFPPTSVAVGKRAIWVGGVGSPGLAAIDPVLLRPAEDLHLAEDLPSSVRAIAIGDASVWLGTDDRIVRVDEKTGRVTRRFDAKRGVSALAYSGGALFAALSDGSVTRIEPVSGRITAHARVPDYVVGLAVHGRELWTLGRWGAQVWQWSADNLVLRNTTDIDAQTRGDVGNGTGIAASGTTVWVSSDHGVWRLDSKNDDPTLRVLTASFKLGTRPRAIVAGSRRIWFAVAERRGAPVAADGTLRINVLDDGDYTLDPALAWSGVSFQREFATCAKLVTYPDRTGHAGLEVVPELARAFPAVSSDGLVYTFRIRDDFRFAPPSNAVVTAADIKATIERALSPRRPYGPGPGASFLRDLVGAPAYIAGKARGIAGIEAAADTLTVRLRRPIPDLLHRLALPYFCVLPRAMPRVPGRLSGPIPTAGPYYIASGRINQRPHTIVLRRNPNYRGERPRLPDRIVYTIGRDRVETERQLDASRADYSADLAEAAYSRLLAAAGPGTAAARAGRQRIFRNRSGGQLYLVLNTARPLFRNARIRRAVAYALNRPALLRAAVGAHAGRPNDQYLTSGWPGFRDAQINGLEGPELDAATAEVGRVRGRAVLWLPSSDYPLPIHPRDAVASLRRSLRAIGLELLVKKWESYDLGPLLNAPSARFDLAFLGFWPDYPDPSSTLNHLYETGYLTGNGVSSTNTSRLIDPRINRALRAAARLSGHARLDAYARLDEQLARNTAAIVPIGQLDDLDAFSERIGCQRYHPLYGMMLGTLCFRDGEPAA